MLKNKKKVILFIMICLSIGYASSFFLGNDNPVEETAEKLIEMKTGIKIDLTPGTPEQ